MIEQPFLSPQSAAVTTESAVRTDDAMAWNDNAHHVLAVGSTDGAAHLHIAKLLRHPRIRPRFTQRDRTQDPLNEGTVFYVLQAFALLSMAGLALAASRHKKFGPLILGGIAVLALFFSFHAKFSAVIVYFGLAGLCVASVWNYLVSRERKCSETGLILKSVITCPKCGNRVEETMSTNTCLFFYDCPKCGAKLKPKSGDCCVFCSYGSVPCPPIQSGAACC
jgi:hypothetical protein